MIRRSLNRQTEHDRPALSTRIQLGSGGPLQHHVWRTAVAVIASLSVLAVLAAPAQASEVIESFKTNAVETSTLPLPEGLGQVVATGFAQGTPNGESFTIETKEGPVDTVEVSPSTTYIDRALRQPSLNDVKVGDFITVFGTISGPTATAAHVAISSPHAGGHPDLSTSFTLASPGEPEAARNIIFKAPEGVFGNPNAVTECTPSSFALDRCPSNSQVGVITVHGNYHGDPDYLLGTAPLFILEPAGEETGLLAFIVPTLNVPIDIPVTVRTDSDYGLTFTVSNISQLTPLAGANLTIWGFPALTAHDTERFSEGATGAPANCPGLANTGCLGKPLPSSIPPHPLTDNPTSCTGKLLKTTLEVQTYQDPEHFSLQESEYPETTGCDLEVFNPVLYTSPTTPETDAASGLNVDLSAPQFLGFAASPSELKRAVVTFPEGFTINPDAADGQTMCTEAEANFDSEGRAHCPDNAKIGTFSIGSEALNGRLEGAIYIGEPKPGEQYRLFEIASGFGINAKLIGSVKPNPETGQVTAYFEDLPQVPFDDFQLHLFASDRGLMATPTQCSVYTTKAEFYPWNITLAEQESSQVFSLEGGPHGSQCPGQIRPFNPTLVAGTSDPTAGAHSSFTLQLNREDGDQYLGHLNFTMPPGLTANLHGITYCPEVEIAAAASRLGKVEQAEPSCPASSEIGTSNVAAGPGSHPFHAYGKIYMAGPFQGAPLSLVAITPALAGPYDYGTVVVRVALHVDPLDAHVIADSETVPEIIGGIPIRMREIQVDIDKSNFMINPTNCSPFSVASQGVGDQGTVANFSSPFQAVNCFSLPFVPQLSIVQLGGRKSAARSKDPALAIELNTRAGDANIKSLTVTLPKAFEIDQRHLGNLCDRAELASDQCAGRQPIGEASTETPLLEKPLQGPVYAVSGFGVLPHLAFILGGQVTLMPEAESSSVQNGRLKTVVPVIPDAPIGHFRFTLFGGSQGYLSNTQNLCSAPTVSTIEFAAQNGKTLTQQVRTKTACKVKKTKRAKRRPRLHRI
jgi:hypothetical protein